MLFRSPKAQIGLLRQMMKLIQNGELLRGIKEARDAGEVYDRFLAAMKGE